MLAQWMSLAAQDPFRKARTESSIRSTRRRWPSSGGFRSVVTGALGANHAWSPRLIPTSRASRLIVGRLTLIPRTPLRDIHWRVGTVMFKSSGGQTDSPATCSNLGNPVRLEVQKASYDQFLLVQGPSAGGVGAPPRTFAGLVTEANPPASSAHARLWKLTEHAPLCDTNPKKTPFQRNVSGMRKAQPGELVS
jgi:hypothetical protein